MSEDIEFYLPSNVDDVRDLELPPIGKNRSLKIVFSEVKENSAGTGMVWGLQYEDINAPNTKLIYDYRSLPKGIDIEGMENEGYIDPVTEKKVSREECIKRVSAAMVSVTEVVKAFKVPYKNVRGKSQVQYSKAVGLVCDECEVLVKPATYRDGNPEIPCPDPTIRGTELDPNFGRDMWDESRQVKLPKLPKASDVK